MSFPCKSYSLARGSDGEIQFKSWTPCYFQGIITKIAHGNDVDIGRMIELRAISMKNRVEVAWKFVWIPTSTTLFRGNQMGIVHTTTVLRGCDVDMTWNLWMSAIESWKWRGSEELVTYPRDIHVISTLFPCFGPISTQSPPHFHVISTK
jgi:hypothetical protein